MLLVIISLQHSDMFFLNIPSLKFRTEVDSKQCKEQFS